MKIFTGYWDKHLVIMNTMVDGDNGISMGMVKGRIIKFWRFSIN